MIAEWRTQWPSIHIKYWASIKPQRKMKFKKLTESLPRRFILISTLATKKPKNSSKKLPVPTPCSATKLKPRQNYYRDYADAGTANPYTHNAGFGDDDDFFSELFRRQGGRGGDGEFKMRGQDARYQLTLDFLSAVNGGKQSLTLPDGSHLEVNIPPGCRDGQTLRLRGKGQLGRGGGTAGDALIEIKVAPHKFFQRVGDDIRIDMPITLKEAVLGAKIKVPTTAGSVTMTVPKGANTGTVLRLKGQGVARANGNHGDQLITLKIMLPTATDQSLEKFISEWRPATEQNPRESMGV
jgi:DnaJ-class molecular chaperone